MLPGGIVLIPALNETIFGAAESADDDTDVTYLGNSNFKVAYVVQEEAR
jgi:hypothetical protein